MSRNPRSTAECDCPQRLRPGDVVEASFKGRYLKWIVREVSDAGELEQSIVASYPGLGSVRFTWYGGHHRRGEGHNMTFYFVERAALNPGSLWVHTNGIEYRLLFTTNTTHHHEKHPPQVVYETLDHPERKWSRPLSDWHRSFTYSPRNTKR